jgi:hypothetical protein
MPSASSAMAFATLALIAQPTMRREKRSITIATCSQPSPVRTIVMSAAQA